MGVDLSAVNSYQFQRNQQFQGWVDGALVAMRKLDKTARLEYFQFSNATYLGPLQAMVYSSAGENGFYLNL